MNGYKIDMAKVMIRRFLGMGQMREPGCGCFWEPGGICNSLLAISIIVC